MDDAGPSLRLELRIKNAVLWRAIRSKFPSAAAFCREHDLPQNEVSSLLTFRKSARTKDGTWCKLSQRIADAIGMEPDILFRDDDYRRIGKCGAFHVREVAASQLTDASHHMRQLAAKPRQSEAEQEDIREAIDSVLQTLTHREREVVKLRYGLGDGNTYTLEETARIFKVTRERLRQLEAKAIRKLQYMGRLIPLCEKLGIDPITKRPADPSPLPCPVSIHPA